MAKRARIGLMVPATNSTAEADFWRVAPPNVTIHSHRLWLSVATGDEAGHHQMNAGLEEGARYLAQARVAAVAMAGTTNSFFRGPGWATEMERIMSQAAGGIPAVATSPSVVQALRAFDVKSISVATPYPEWENHRLRTYFEAMGFAVLNVEGEPWAARAGVQAMNDQEPADIERFGSSVCRAQADALFCSCSGWRAMEVAAALEQCLGTLVVTAVQATVWRVFHTAGLREPIRGAGRLLELMPNPASLG